MEIFLIQNNLVAVREGVTLYERDRYQLLKYSDFVLTVDSRKSLQVEITKNRYDSRLLGFFSLSEALDCIEFMSPQSAVKNRGIHLLTSYYETTQYLISLGVERREFDWKD